MINYKKPVYNSPFANRQPSTYYTPAQLQYLQAQQEQESQVPQMLGKMGELYGMFGQGSTVASPDKLASFYNAQPAESIGQFGSSDMGQFYNSPSSGMTGSIGQAPVDLSQYAGLLSSIPQVTQNPSMFQGLLGMFGGR